jgi:hypothetical protein
MAETSGVSLQVPSNRFPTLSIRDLIEARDAYHVHLMNIGSVVGTAIGRFREMSRWIKDSSLDPAKWKPREIKRPRTLANSIITEQSWPCILVFVNRWYSREELADARKLDLLVPPRLYLPDGRVIPTCVIYVQADKAGPPPLAGLNFPSGLLGGGYPVLTDVQQEEHVSTVGCLVTDGDLVFALTNRHVTGEVRAGESRREIFAILNGKKTRVGVVDLRQIGKVPFEKVYPEWPGRFVLSNLDAGLVAVDDVRHWTSQIYGLGELGPLFDIHPHSLTLDLIGTKVRGFGAASGVMDGEIHGFFYRYKSVGGFDYVSDLLIGPRALTNDLHTHPGDSGSVWCLEVQRAEDDPLKGRNPLFSPLAVQWGGHRFMSPGSNEGVYQFALATFLSTICHQLDVELLPEHNTGFREYWGKLGHFKVAAKACEMVSNSRLKKLMMANLDRIAYSDQVLSGQLPTFPNPTEQFVPLADVSDIVWRTTRKMDRANHFADMDHEGMASFSGKTLLDLCQDPKNVDGRVWQSFYESIDTDKQDRGALPFRIWQMYEEMVAYLKKGKVAEFVCMAGLMAHYAGDACQPLHISQFHDGEVASDQGVHSAYETQMLDRNSAELVAAVNQAIQGWKAKVEVKGGHEAAVRTVELMRETYATLPPLDIIEVYRASAGPKAMWNPLKDRTVKCFLKGSQNLAILWESAWKEGNGSKVPNSKLVQVDTGTLKDLYNDRDFAKAMWLDDMVEAGIGIVPD